MNSKHNHYAKKFVQMDKEALYTLILSVVIFVFFWGAIFILQNCQATLWQMPLWFVISCIGGYLLSVVGVAVLIKYFIKDFDLEDK
jgi:uncharacterized membrane protein YhdT